MAVIAGGRRLSSSLPRCAFVAEMLQGAAEDRVQASKRSDQRLNSELGPVEPL
jgi:hypothetical protein